MSQMNQYEISSFNSLNHVNTASFQTSTRSQGIADRDAVDSFNKAMEERDGSHGSEEQAFQPRCDIPMQAQDASSLFSVASFGSFFTDSVEQVTAPSALSEFDLDMLVERILVSRPESGGNEVRLILGTELLRGTEVIIQRDMLGLLSVQLHANDAAAFQTLVASQNDLKHLLEVHETSPVSVMVENGNDDPNDTDRRSRGLFQQEEAEA